MEKIQAAVYGAISHEQVVKLRQCLDHIDELGKHKAKIEQEIFRISDSSSAALNLIRNVPGLNKNPFTTIQILSEIGGDCLFSLQANILSLGLDFVLEMIKATLKSTRISRAGNYLKTILVQVANALIKSKKHSEITERYRRIKSHRGHKKAVIAICRMLPTDI